MKILKSKSKPKNSQNQIPTNKSEIKWIKGRLSKERPKPLSSFLSFLVNIPNRRIDNPFPCDECYGWKTIVAPGEVSDVIEGHKFSKRIKCPKCAGTGQLTEKYWRHVYQTEKQKRQQEIDIWDKLYKDFKSIILTADQWDAIRFFEGRKPKR